MMLECNLISNAWQEGQGKAFISTNPANNELLWQGHAASEAQVHAAVDAAREAFLPWSQTPLAARQECLQRFARVLTANRRRLAWLISQETGKPLWEASSEVAAMIAKIDISNQAYQQRTANTEMQLADAVTATRHKPHGVLAVFGPYNFPGHLPNGHIIPALLAGNTVVFKASEHTPAVAAQTLHFWLEAGCPAGVINLLQGGKETGAALANCLGIDGILFTGSYKTGQWLHQNCAGATGKLLALEMGGNNPLLVFDVDDVDAAVYQTVQSAFITSGQRCTCARRLLIANDSKADVFLERLLAVSSQLQVANPEKKPEPFMGAVISTEVAANLLATQQQCLQQGATSLLTMRQLEKTTAFLTPGIMDVTACKARTDEEWFGPLLQVIRVDNFQQALEEANNTRYGLSAALLSDNRALYQQFYTQIRAGIVNWNKATTGASSSAPFGGIGQSGNLRPSAFYAADYCAYPVASVEAERCQLPEQLSPGVSLP